MKDTNDNDNCIVFNIKVLKVKQIVFVFGVFNVSSVLVFVLLSLSWEGLPSSPCL